MNNGQTAMVCDPTGSTWQATQTCDTTQGLACRAGTCAELCNEASAEQSNVGCEYWGVDLDNADVSPTLNAAAQQYAIVVSNVEDDVPAHVVVDPLACDLVSLSDAVASLAVAADT